MPRLFAHAPLELLAFAPAALAVLFAVVNERREAAREHRHAQVPQTHSPKGRHE